MEGGKLCRVIGYGVLALLQTLGWLMAVGGTGKLHDECRDVLSDKSCAEEFRTVWWTIFLQLYVLLAVAGFVAANALEKYRIPLVAFLVLATARTMTAAELALRGRDSGLSESGADAASGGFVIASLLNFVMVALVGSTGVPNVNVAVMNERLRAMLARAQPRPQEAPPPPGVPAPQMPGVPSPAAGYPKHDGFQPHPPPTFDYTQQQQQQQQYPQQPGAPANV